MWFAPSDHAKPVESWPTMRSKISFNQNHLTRIERSSCIRVSPTILGHNPRLAHISPVRWRLNHRDASMHLHDELQSNFIVAVRFHLKPFWRTCLDEDRVDLGPRDRHPCVYRNHIRCLGYCHVTCKRELLREDSSTQKKWGRILSIKGGAAKRICVTTPNS